MVFLSLSQTRISISFPNTHYRPQRSCGQGNVFTGVCLSTGGEGVCLSACWDAIPPRDGWILRARDRDRDILTRLRLGHQRPVNRGCPDEKYQYVNNNRLTEYPGTPAWTPATSKLRVSNERKKSYFFPFFHLFAK